MIRLFAASSVWNRLLMIVLGIVLVVWLVLATAIWFFLQIQKDFDTIAREQLPDLALSSQLAEHSAHLSRISTELLNTRGQLPEDLTTELADLRQNLLSSLSNIRPSERAQNAPRQVEQITAHLSAIAALQETGLRDAEALQQQIVNLRWINADIQAEVDPTLNDFAFNISVAMRSLVTSTDRAFRDRQAQLIATENVKRDAVRRLGDGAATLVTLLLQGAVADSEKHLLQLRGLSDDASADLQVLLAELPNLAELSTLQQSVRSLQEVAAQEDGLFSLRRDWLRTQQALLARLTTLQHSLQGLQASLSEIGSHQRSVILSETQASLEKSQLAIRWLSVLSVLSVAIGTWAMFGPVRRGIVRPLRQMTRQLSEIAQTQSVEIPVSNQDEIGRLALAISEFERSIETRDAALGSLEAEVQEHRRTVETLKRTQKELIQAGKMAALGQMSAGIAHELNQPLAAMQHRITLLRTGREADDKAATEKQINRLEGLINRMNRTITYLRNFARRADFRDDSLSLRGLVEDAIALLQARLQPADVTLTLDDSLDIARVRGDKILVEQVIVNVLSNAIDAIELGEVRGEIVVTASREVDHIALSFRDNGAGLGPISPTDAMDPFVTGKEVGKGLGLGLSISYNIMKDLGGDLKLAANEDGVGTTATLQMRIGKDQ